MKVLTQGKFKFIKAWSFPKDISKFAAWLMNYHGGNTWNHAENLWDSIPWLHMFCGTSFLGDIRTDINKKKNVTLVCDYKELVEKLGFGSQKRIILDPPWQIKPQDRMNISYAVRDLLEIGGIAIFNCTWSPWCQGFTKFVNDENRSEVWIPQAHFNGYLDSRHWWKMERIEYG